MKKILILAISDFKLIFRDSSIRAFLFFPFILFWVFVFLLPYLVDKYDFLTPYISIFLIIGVIESTQMFSFISSMVLIDEKETDVAKVYWVTPLSKVEYIFSRLLIPFLITLLLNIILLWVQPFYYIGIILNLIISFLTALVVPIYVLIINSIVQNRMQWMIYIKALNMLVLLPLASFFISATFKPFFFLFPTYWIFQTIQNVIDGSSIIMSATISFIFLILVLIFISKIFISKHFR